MIKYYTIVHTFPRNQTGAEKVRIIRTLKQKQKTHKYNNNCTTSTSTFFVLNKILLSSLLRKAIIYNTIVEFNNPCFTIVDL